MAAAHTTEQVFRQTLWRALLAGFLLLGCGPRGAGGLSSWSKLHSAVVDVASEADAEWQQERLFMLSRRNTSAEHGRGDADVSRGIPVQDLCRRTDKSKHTSMWFGKSPWLMLKCWRARAASAAILAGAPVHSAAVVSLLGVDRGDPIPRLDIDQDGHIHVDIYMLLGVAMFVCALLFTLAGLRDLHRFVMLFARNVMEAKRQTSGDLSPAHSDEISLGSTPPVKVATTSDDGEKELVEKWSVVGIVALCSLRFYTGFLSATWLPYLLAMEGAELFGEKQAMFMALAKLIYGASILLNPIFGFIGDRAVAMSHGTGRRLFLRAGITLAALGIYICVLSGRERGFMGFLTGILVWRLGEALNDVTTEALVPEMVPQSQFEIASAIKASMFLIGGLFGYTILITFADVHYSWLYYAYPFGMFFCVLPSIYLLDRDQPFPPCQSKRHMASALEDKSFHDSLVEAYVAPSQYEGGFPLASLAVFLFGLGTSPMFFLLLIVRDLVGISDPVEAQRQFSVASICFFLAAAVASILAAVLDPGKKSAHQLQEERRQGLSVSKEAILLRGRLLCIAMIFCGLFVMMLPMMVFWKTEWARFMAFLFITTLFGASFGICFSLFQDMTWKLLPSDVNLACAMGFNVMCRLSGIGLGNCVCGLILDLSYNGAQNAYGEDVYEFGGYLIMCTLSGLLMFASCVIARLATLRAAEEKLKEERSRQVS